MSPLLRLTSSQFRSQGIPHISSCWLEGLSNQYQGKGLPDSARLRRLRSGHSGHAPPGPAQERFGLKEARPLASTYCLSLLAGGSSGTNSGGGPGQPAVRGKKKSSLLFPVAWIPDAFQVAPARRQRGVEDKLPCRFLPVLFCSWGQSMCKQAECFHSDIQAESLSYPLNVVSLRVPHAFSKRHSTKSSWDCSCPCQELLQVETLA